MDPKGMLEVCADTADVLEAGVTTADELELLMTLCRLANHPVNEKCEELTLPTQSHSRPPRVWRSLEQNHNCIPSRLSLAHTPRRGIIKYRLSSGK